MTNEVGIPAALASRLFHEMPWALLDEYAAYRNDRLLREMAIPKDMDQCNLQWGRLDEVKKLFALRQACETKLQNNTPKT